jgi:hypothetical protein
MDREAKVVETTQGKSKTRRAVRMVFAGLAFLLTGVVLLEGILRVVLGLGHPVLLVRDPACGYMLKPNQNLFRFFVHTRTNRYGMRSDEVQPQHPANTLRLFFIGDSITYGTSRVDQSAIFTEILHRELPAIVHEPVEVLNASASAWAPDNELSYLQSRGTFQSDVVVLVLNSGDLAQPRSDASELEDLTFIGDKTAIGEVYRRYLHHWLFGSSHHVDAGDTADVNNQAVIHANLADLGAFQMLVEQAHGRMAIVYTPFQKDIASAEVWAAILREWSASHHVPLLDTTAYQQPFNCSQIALSDCTHFNAKGNRVIADAFEKFWSEALEGR